VNDPEIVDKVTKLFNCKVEEYKTRGGWEEYLNGLDITIISAHELISEFSDMINNEYFFDKKWLCVEDPINESWRLNEEFGRFLLIEKEFAHKIAVLGLP
jgi:hypothetical protein